MVIAVLRPEVQNQIAAGEVVERPFSVVKELVENALDAGATRLRIELAQGGRELVRVTDDGEGFLPEDLPLAFASHATSKLSELRDLDHIASLGFRGEALASIGSVARCVIKSRRHDRDEGWEVRCDAGQQTAPQPCGSPPGTQIEVRDLFWPVPARRKFLKTPGAEKARIQELVQELALARLDVDWTLLHDGKEVLRLPAGQTLDERFAACFGRELARGLLPVERAFGAMRIEGLVGEPDLARRDGKLELLFVNGRRATERSATFAVRQAYREFLMGGRFPIYALMVAMPPDQVDVNVHPRKAEVRFLEGRRVAGSLYETVRAALRERGLGGEAIAGAEGVAGGAPSGGPGGVVVDPDKPRARSGFSAPQRELFAPRLAPTGSADLPPPPVIVRERHAAPADAPPAAHRPNPFRHDGPLRFLQAHDLYVVLAAPDGLMVVDQHALHERVVYERLRAQHRARGVQVQRLLAPAVVELAPSEKAWVLDAAEVLQRGGLEVADFGPGNVAVHAVPAVFHRADPGRLLRAVLPVDGCEDAAERLEDQLVERFHSMACRSAVMSGDRLTQDEIEALLQEAATLEHPHNCPHGRPTVLTFTGAELERYFRRRC
ncbi:MAG: DNA mismatch repair endonuclease MutL [Planctomycetota bacterium]